MTQATPGASAPAFANGEIVIRQRDGIFCLNDLHEVFGGELRHKPARFTRRRWTKIKIAQNGWSLKTATGIYGGSYGCKNLALAYAAWIDPSFRSKALPLLYGAKTPEPAQPAPWLPTPAFTIGKTVIHQRDGLFSLGNLHKASGSGEVHTPYRFLRRGSTRALIAKNNWPFSISCGPNGSYACRELAIEYAASIDPVFHRAVLRAFGVEAAQPAGPEAAPSPVIGNTRHADILYRLVWARTQGNPVGRHWLWAALNAHFGLKGYRNLPLSRIDEAYAFVQTAVLPSLSANPAPAPAPAPEAPLSVRDALLLAADLEGKRQEAERRAAVKPAPATLRDALLLALELAEKQTKALAFAEKRVEALDLAEKRTKAPAFAEKQRSAAKSPGADAAVIPDADDPQKWASRTDMLRVSDLRPSGVLLRRASQKLGIPIRRSYTKWGNEQNLYHAAVWRTCYGLEIPKMEASHEPRP